MSVCVLLSELCATAGSSAENKTTHQKLKKSLISLSSVCAPMFLT